MRIDSLWIEKMGRLNNFTLHLPTQDHSSQFKNLHISILVGENGTGKTSLLQFLAYAFLFPKAFEDKISNAFWIKYSIGDKGYHISNESPMDSVDTTAQPAPEKVIVSTYSAFEQYEYERHPPNTFRGRESVETRVKYAYAGPMDGWGSSLGPTYFPILESFFDVERHATAQSKGIRELLREINCESPPAVEFDPNPRVRIPLQYQRDFRLPEVVSQMLRCPSDHPVWTEIPREPLERLVEFRRRCGRMLRRPNRRYLIEPDIVEAEYPNGTRGWFDDLRQANSSGINFVRGLRFWKDGNWVSMLALSSGELSLFYRFFRLLQLVTDDCLVLIDEPETHLHPKWIRHYVDMLVRLFNDRRAHFILATHSPIIAADVPNESIIGLRSNNGIVETYTVKEPTMGARQSEILQEVFGLDDHLGTFTRHMIDQIKNHLQAGELPQAQELLDKLGLSDEKYKLLLIMQRKYPELFRNPKEH